MALLLASSTCRCALPVRAAPRGSARPTHATSRPAVLPVHPALAGIGGFRKGGALTRGVSPARRGPTVVASGDRDVLGQSPEEWGARTAGAFIPVCAWSLLTLATTGQGVNPGPGGLYGAAEGLSYLLLAGYVGWSLYSKVTKGLFLAEVVGPCCLLVKYVEPASYGTAALALVVGLTQLL